MCYEIGERCTGLYCCAAVLLAADQGHAQAQTNLGAYYYNGYGVTQDYDEAVRLYKLAVDQGDANAQYNLGQCYKHGFGVLQDLKEAQRLYKLAADQGHALAQQAVTIMP